MVQTESLRAFLASRFYYEDGKLYYNYSNRRVKKGQEAGSMDVYGYKQVNVEGKVYKVHRVIYLLCTGEYPDLIDHIDRNRLNNHITNLRPATKSENALNTVCHRDNSLGLKNISKRKDYDGYLVQVSVKGVKKSKSCTTLEDALKYREEFYEFFNI